MGHHAKRAACTRYPADPEGARRRGMRLSASITSDSYFHSCTAPTVTNCPPPAGLGQVFIRIFGQFLYPRQRGQQTVDIHEEFIPQGMPCDKMTSSR